MDLEHSSTSCRRIHFHNNSRGAVPACTSVFQRNLVSQQHNNANPAPDPLIGKGEHSKPSRTHYEERAVTDKYRPLQNVLFQSSKGSVSFLSSPSFGYPSFFNSWRIVLFQMYSLKVGMYKYIYSDINKRQLPLQESL